MSTCILSSFDLDDYFIEIVSIALTKEVNDDFINKTCYYTRNIYKPCVRDFYGSVKVCLPEEILKIEAQLQASDVLIDFFCSKNAEDYKSLTSFRTDECLISKEPQVLQCFTDNFKFYTNKSTQETIRIFFKSIEKEVCQNIIDFEQCFIGVFDNCDNKRPVEFFTSFFRYMLENSTCEEKKAAVTEIIDNVL